MTHNPATHTGNVIHGYVLAHLTNPAQAPQAIADCLTPQMRAQGVKTATDVGGAVLVYAELPAPPHLPVPPLPKPPVPPGDTAAHARIGALETQIKAQPIGSTSYYDWTKHW
jgi:hypothetical protein